MRRLIPLLALLLWPLTASAQIVSPGGGQMLSSATIVGGTCTNPQFVQGLSTSGTPTCATPSLGSGVPNGSPPQFVGYSATNVGESETLGGDATMTRTGANAYSLVVTKTNGTVFSTLATASIPLAISLGGTGNGSAPTAGQILIAQSGTAFSPQAVSGDATITNGGALTVTKTGGTAFTAIATAAVPLSIALGGRGTSTAPTAGQLSIAQSATAFGSVSMSGDATITSAGVITVTKLANTTPGGACSAGTFVTSIGATAAPTCASSLASPTFTGTLTFPDGSTYTSAGHQSMKALGIGEATQANYLLAATTSANAGASILVSNPTTGTAASAGFEIDTGTGGSIYPTYISANGAGNTSNPFYPANSMAIETSEPNGLFIGANAAPNIIHFNVAANEFVRFSGPTSTLSATASPWNDVVAINSTIATNAAGNVANMLGITANGPWNTAVVLNNNNATGGASENFYVNDDASEYAALGLYNTGFPPSPPVTHNEAYVGTNAANGLLLNSGTTAPISFAVNATQMGSFNTYGLFLPLGNQSQLYLGATPPSTGVAGSILGWSPGSPNAIYLFGGAYYFNGRIPTGPSAEEIALNPGTITFNINSGLTAGTAYNAVTVGAWGGAGLIVNGQYKNNNVNGYVPTVSSGAVLQGGSSDSVGEIISAAGSNTVTLTFSHCFTGSNVQCFLSDDGQGYFWIPYSKGNCGVSFSCVVPNTGGGCPGNNYVAYFCIGEGG